MPKLILLYAFAGVGKSTIARRYIKENKLSLLIEGDQIIHNIGLYLDSYKEARQLVFVQTMTMAATHLSHGYDVIVPYLLVHPEQAIELNKIATDKGAEFKEIYIKLGKEKSLDRLIARGRWGEEDSPELDEAEMEKATRLYHEMEVAMNTRNQAIIIGYHLDNIEKTYSEFIKAVG
jgi:predicted kinase